MTWMLLMTTFKIALALLVHPLDYICTIDMYQQVVQRMVLFGLLWKLHVETS